MSIELLGRILPIYVVAFLFNETFSRDRVVLMGMMYEQLQTTGSCYCSVLLRVGMLSGHLQSADAAECL